MNEARTRRKSAPPFLLRLTRAGQLRGETRVEYSREQGIEDSLSSQERVVGGDLLSDRSRSSNGPDLVHGVAGDLTLELSLEDDVLDKEEEEGWVSDSEKEESKGKEGVSSSRRRCRIPSQRLE